MSTPVQTDSHAGQSANMYAPPWARESAPEARDAAVAAIENVVAASEQFRRTLPPASQLGERRMRRREVPFEGDLAAMRLRERPTLEPVEVPAPPIARGSPVGLLARVAGAIGLAALAAFFMVGTAPFSLAVKAEGDAPVPSLWTRIVGKSARTPASAPAAVTPTPIAERFAVQSEPAPVPPPRPVQTVAISMPPAPVQSVPAVAAAPVTASTPDAVTKPRALDRDEIAILYRRSEDLISQGDIAGGRLLLTRAAEAGDARSALALGATYDPAVLGKLPVLGVRADPERAKTWYAKAAEFGSGEAAKRLEVLAQGR